MMAAPDITTAEEDAFKEALGTWNMEVTGLRDYAPVNQVLKDEAGTIRGGVLAYVWGKWLHVETVWIEEEFRGQDWGTRLLEAVHLEGKAKGAEAAFLDTFDWQARPFYERFGYEVVATVEMPAGHERYFMSKRLGD
jgi:N-acetylglutamate synthase-like GNAT family acetyltransferase